MNNTTLDFFDFQSSFYDKYQSACVPRYGEMSAVCMRFLAKALKGSRAPSVLDLGCGTGNTIARILRTFPKAHVTAVDGSRDMLERARDKHAGNAVEFVHRDLGSPDWGTALALESFDAAVSVLVLEHLDFPRYRECMNTVSGLLKPGGWAITIEAYAGDLNLEIFLDEMAGLEAQAVKDGLFDGDELNRMKRLSEETESHYFATMDEKKQWWKDAGFTDVQFVWQYWCVAALVGKRPD